jgi:hypothetical protein
MVVMAGALPAAADAAHRTAGRVLEVRTVPPTSGMRFELDGRRFASRGGGLARIELGSNTPLRGRLVGVPTTTRPGLRATLLRWYGNIDKPGRTTVTAALGLHYAVRLTFTDLEGVHVDSKRVTSVTLRASNGVVQRVKGDEVSDPVWLQGKRVVSTPTGPVEKEILYSVERVVVDGANVVNRAQQRFYPHRTRNVEVALLFYSARFTARDALFGFGVGDGIKLTHPDGTSTYHAFESGNQVRVTALARGEYWVEVDGPGVSFLRPVTLSRNQVVELEVLSYLDLGLTFGILLATALGLLYIGRPHLFSFARVARIREQAARFGART